MKKNILKYLLIICALILILDGYMSKNALEIKHYTISDNRLKSSFKLVLLSDLHNSEFGEQNERLIAKIDSVKPDIIFIAGDLIDFKIKNKQIAINLIERLSIKYPVYISLGNHEAQYDELFNDLISKDYENAGATVLNLDYVDLHIGKNDIRLGGLNGYCLPEPDCGISDWLLQDAEFIRDFENTDEVKFLLCHMPAAWLKSGSLYEYDVDYIFSGHVHGGQIRLPIIGGLWAPDLGWFPGKVCGLFYTNQEGWVEYKDRQLRYVNWIVKQVDEKKFDNNEEYLKNKSFSQEYIQNLENKELEESVLILTKGLGSTEKIPRFNNIPEITVVDFKTE